MKFELEAIGTHWWIDIFDEDIDKDEIVNLTKEVFTEFEQNYSRFIDTSYVSILNRDKSIKDFPNELYQMLRYSEELSRLTEGHFSVAAGTILENTGYDKEYSFTKKGELNYSDLRKPVLELTPERIVIKEEVKVDFGGIGKGWLIDKLKLHFFDKEIKHFYINGGGDIYATSRNGKPIEFYLESPFDTDSVIGSITIKDCAIACSSPSKRKWRDKKTGKIFHHLVSANSPILDNKVSAVYTKAKTALQADSAGTCLFVSPSSIVDSIAEGLDVEFMIVYEDKRFIESENYGVRMF